jgi:hypothetical protein
MQTTYVFIVRVWREPREIEGAAPICRGVIEHVPSGERQALGDLESILGFISACIQGREQPLKTLALLRRYVSMVTIENLTNRLVSLRLNSGTTLHLPPGTNSLEIIDVEVESNAEVQKLQDRRVIALHDSATATATKDKSAAAATKDESATTAERSSAKPPKK